MLRDYMTVLNILMQNEDITFEDVMNRVKTSEQPTKDTDSQSDDTPAPKRIFSATDIDF
jgi:hypothetical protein